MANVSAVRVLIQFHFIHLENHDSLNEEEIAAKACTLIAISSNLIVCYLLLFLNFMFPIRTTDISNLYGIYYVFL